MPSQHQIARVHWLLEESVEHVRRDGFESPICFVASDGAGATTMRGEIVFAPTGGFTLESVDGDIGGRLVREFLFVDAAGRCARQSVELGRDPTKAS